MLHFVERRVEDGPRAFATVVAVLPLYKPVGMAVLVVLIAAVIPVAVCIYRVDVAIRVEPGINLDAACVCILD